MPTSVIIRVLHTDNFYSILIGEQNLCDFCFLLVGDLANCKPSSFVMQRLLAFVKHQN
jgi:hypothetical protein